MAGTHAPPGEGGGGAASPSGGQAGTGGGNPHSTRPPPPPPPPPPKPDVNWAALDDMVLDYLAQEGCIEPVPPAAATNAAKRAASEAVRAAIMAGDIPRALDVAAAAHPGLLGPPGGGPPPKPPAPQPSDERLRFRLERQHVLDLLRGPGGGGGDAAARRAAALDALRTRLAPRALGASPDEFPAFRSTLVALVCDPPPPGGGGGAGPPPSLQPPPAGPGSTTTASLTEHAALPPPDVAALWSDSSRAALAGLAARSVRAATRWAPPRLEAAVRYLALAQRAAGGRRPLDVASLEALAGGARDGRPLAPPPPPLAESEGKGGAAPATTATTTTATSASVAEAEADVQRLRVALVLPREEASAALRAARERGVRVAALLDAALLDELGALTGGRALLAGLAAEYAAVRGLVGVPDESTLKPASSRPRWVPGSAPVCAAASAAASRLAAAALAGDADAVEASLEAASPGLLAQRPDAAFALLRARFAALAAAGDALGALSLARTRLAPLAAGNPALHDDIKAAVAGLLPASSSQDGGDSLAPAPSDGVGGGGAANKKPATRPAWPGGLDPSLGAAIAAATGAPLYPRLASLVSSLLDAHALWFRVQRDSRDGLAAAAGVEALHPIGWCEGEAARRAEAAAGMAVGRSGGPTIVGGAEPRGGHGDPRIAGGSPPEASHLASDDADFPDIDESGRHEGVEVVALAALLAGPRGRRMDSESHPSDSDGMPMNSDEDDHPPPSSDEEDEAPPPRDGADPRGVPGGGGPPPMSEEAITLVMEFTGMGREAAIDVLSIHGGEAQAAVAAIFN